MVVAKVRIRLILQEHIPTRDPGGDVLCRGSLVPDFVVVCSEDAEVRRPYFPVAV